MFRNKQNPAYQPEMSRSLPSCISFLLQPLTGMTKVEANWKVLKNTVVLPDHYLFSPKHSLKEKEVAGEHKEDYISSAISKKQP